MTPIVFKSGYAGTEDKNIKVDTHKPSASLGMFRKSLVMS
jgi:hypothetical protein